MGFRATREDVADKKALWNYLHATHNCCTCGAKGPLEFHHIDPGTKYRSWSHKKHRYRPVEVSYMKTSRYTTPRDFVKEIKKCALVCTDCHRIIEGDVEGEVDLTKLVVVNPYPAIKQLRRAGVLYSGRLLSWDSGNSSPRKPQ